MEPKAELGEFGSGEMGFGFDEIQTLISAPQTGGSSFTALLELPPPQAVELLVNEDFSAKNPLPPFFSSSFTLTDSEPNFSIFANLADNNSPENNTVLSVSRPMKQEPLDTDPQPEYSSPAVSNQSLHSGKRKEREKKVKESNKKSKEVANEASEEGGEKLPYVHMRAPRGQATNSHSLAERARREKINARMKLLQELVPGCNKISGTAMVLDEIINHVQSLQRQVEFLSIRLASVNPGIDFNLDALLAASGSSFDNAYMDVFAPSISHEEQINDSKQPQYLQQWHCDEFHQPLWPREVDNSNFIAPENAVQVYDSSPNPASLLSSQLKMEL
ncbi:hypothetical protein ABFX02_10G170200 [Erythranthe guttata]